MAIQPLDDTDVLSASVVQPNGRVEFTCPDGHIIARGAPPQTGKEAIEWCQAVRDIVAQRARDVAEEHQAKAERKKLDAELAEESAPISDSIAIVIDTEAKPSVSTDQTKEPTLIDPAEWATIQRKHFSDAMVACGAHLEQLKTQYAEYTDAWRRWDKIVRVLELTPIGFSELDEETDAAMSMRIRREAMPLPTDDEARMDDESGS